jgi:hypothetical protein
VLANVPEAVVLLYQTQHCPSPDTTPAHDERPPGVRVARAVFPAVHSRHQDVAACALAIVGARDHHQVKAIAAAEGFSR